jgi:hypothetical protein
VEERKEEQKKTDQKVAQLEEEHRKNNILIFELEERGLPQHTSCEEILETNNKTRAVRWEHQLCGKVVKKERSATNLSEITSFLVKLEVLKKTYNPVSSQIRTDEDFSI